MKQSIDGIRVFTVLLLLLHAAACADTATCDEDERFSNGMCLPAGSGGEPAPDDSPDAAAPNDAARVGEFGAECTVNSDCGDPAPVCAIQETDAVGFCSQVDCVDAPDVCPAGWQCFDPSVINPDWPTVCVPSN